MQEFGIMPIHEVDRASYIITEGLSLSSSGQLVPVDLALAVICGLTTVFRAKRIAPPYKIGNANQNLINELKMDITKILP